LLFGGTGGGTGGGPGGVGYGLSSSSLIVIPSTVAITKSKINPIILNL
jgi:hypothetical protein